jgi:hypothetical protein
MASYNANKLYLRAIAQDLNYELPQLNQDIVNDKLFGFSKVGIETPEHLKESSVRWHYNFKTLKSNCGGMQFFHTENNIPINKGNK